MTLGLMLVSLLASTPALRLSAAASEGRVSVSIESSDALGAQDVSRTGDTIIIRVEGALEGPPPELPPGSLIRALTCEREGVQLVTRITVAPGVVHAVRRDERSLAILLEPPTDMPADAAPSPETDAVPTAELYRRLFPVSPTAGSEGAAQEGLGGVLPGEGEPMPGVAGSGGTGLILGRVTLRPWVSAGYVDAEYVPPEGGQAQREQFFQVQPRIDASAPIGAGSVRAGYEPRFRAGSSASAIRRTSHLVDAALQMPLGTRAEADLSDHYSHGVLETEEVDPGREYFYDLAAFTAHQLASSLRFEFGASMYVRLAARAGRVRFDRRGGFFDRDSRGASGDLGRELTPNLRLALRVAYDEIDAPERTEAAMHASTASLVLDGDLTPLTHGSVSVGWTRQENPQAPAAGRRFDGFVTSTSIRRELGYSTAVAVSATRGTHPSAYGSDGFFVTTAGQIDVSLPLPFAVSFRGGTGYHVNQYRVAAAENGGPRQDQIVFWSVGLGRALGRWGFCRVDYRGERRNSNRDEFDHTVRTLVLRIGLGYFGEPRRP